MLPVPLASRQAPGMTGLQPYATAPVRNSRPPHHMKKLYLTLGILALGCGGGASTGQPAPGQPSAPAAPWSAPSIAASAAPEPLLTEWRAAENSATCAPIAPASLGEHASATPRRANFSGGWAVAWDLPELRSAFGVAGTGVRAIEPSYDEWPHRRAWADGSTAGYGPEGGTGPRQLAYLRITGQECLYNVWSHLGREHLEALLGQLRFVQVP